MLQTIKILSYDVQSNDVSSATTADTSELNLHNVLANVKQYDLKNEVEIPQDHICINLYFMDSDSRNLISNDLLFNKALMTELWTRGGNYRSNSDREYHILSKDAAKSIVAKFREDLERKYPRTLQIAQR